NSAVCRGTMTLSEAIKLSRDQGPERITTLPQRSADDVAQPARLRRRTKTSPFRDRNEINPSDLQFRLGVAKEEMRKAGRQETRKRIHNAACLPIRLLHSCFPAFLKKTL